MENKIEFIPSEMQYLEDVKLLLREYKLPYEDIDEHFTHFILARKEEKIVGAIGLEIYGNIGLLRSFVVDKALRNKKIGDTLILSLFNYSFEQGIKTLYLLTITAEKYFLKYEFQVENKDNLPKLIKQTK